MSDFTVQRDTMIESQIRPNGVTNVSLLKVMLDTPRENFVPPSQRALAYMDGALRVETARDGQPARYLLSPLVFARLAQLARIKPSDRVLDIGPATGYSTAIFARLARDVVALESDAGLAAIAQDALEGEGLENIKVVSEVLEAGCPDEGPFDVIFLNGRVEREPESLFGQLSSSGRLVAVVGGETAAKGSLFMKLDGTVQEVSAFDAGAPLLPGFKVKQEFTF